jgi:hypothetical protein
MPGFGNLILSLILIRKHYFLNKKLNEFGENKIIQIVDFPNKQFNRVIDTNEICEEVKITDDNNKTVIELLQDTDVNVPMSNDNIADNFDPLNDKNTITINNNIEDKVFLSFNVFGLRFKLNNFKPKSSLNQQKNDILNDFNVEFLRTCCPCILFSLTHAALFLPFGILEIFNQTNPKFILISALEYMSYIRYLFYCCKFYLLYIISYSFRREFFEFFQRKK